MLKEAIYNQYILKWEFFGILKRSGHKNNLLKSVTLQTLSFVNIEVILASPIKTQGKERQFE